jgi:hypothetical protein
MMILNYKVLSLCDVRAESVKIESVVDIQWKVLRRSGYLPNRRDSRIICKEDE